MPCFAQEFKDGSVFFFKDGYLARPIQNHTGSTITHTAILLYDDEPYVYEAIFPRVRRVPLNEYLDFIRSMQSRLIPSRRCASWFVVNPNLTEEQLSKAKLYANSQLGTKYMMKGFWKNKTVQGIHCSQFVSETLNIAGLPIDYGPKVAPVDIYRQLNNE